jgi:hypothetical protein
MNSDVLVRYPKEHLLKRKQFFAHVNILPKKFATEGKIKPSGFQKEGHESKHLRVTWFGHFIMPFGTKKCQSQHVLLHRKE